MIVTDTGPLADTERSDGMGRGYGDPLTPRQQMILRLLAEGHSTLQVAYLCGISKTTLWNHLSDAKARIGAFTTTRAVVLYAIAQAGSGQLGRGSAIPVSAPPDPRRQREDAHFSGPEWQALAEKHR